MKKYTAILSLIVVLFLILGACSSLKVTSDYDKTADFSQHKTYSYLGWQEKSDRILNRFDKERLEKAFAEEFKKRGIEYVKEGGDIAVSLYIVVEQKTDRTAYTNHYGSYGYGYNSWGWGGGPSTTTYSEYDYFVGTLVCDVFDNSSKQLIWQGVGSGEIDQNPENRERGIPRAVKKIMYYYPVKPMPK